MKKNVRLKLFTIIALLLLSLCSCRVTTDKPSDMTDDIFEFTFKIDGITYKLPERIDMFTDNGWEFPEDFDGFDNTIKSKGLKETYLEKGDNWFAIEIFNNSDEDLPIKDCPIGRIIYDFSGDIEIAMAGDYIINDKTLDDVTKQFGEPLSQKDYSTYTEIIYDKDPSEGIYDRYTLRFELDTKILKYFDATYYYG